MNEIPTFTDIPLTMNESDDIVDPLEKKENKESLDDLGIDDKLEALDNHEAQTLKSLRGV
jgi:hypothetical protein